MFFVKTVTLLRDDPEVHSDPKAIGNRVLLDTLTFRFLEREREEKLLDRQQTPLLSKDDLESLMADLAQEMWSEETRELDRDSVREVAEFVLESREVPESARQVVVRAQPPLQEIAHTASPEARRTVARPVYAVVRWVDCEVLESRVEGSDHRVP